MAKFFIHRPVFAIVISIIISLIGIIAGMNTPTNISPPTINVSAFYTGANASVVNQAVAQIIENRVNGTQGMDYMSSNSNDDGSYSLNVFLKSDRTAIWTRLKFKIMLPPPIQVCLKRLLRQVSQLPNLRRICQ